MKYYSSRLLIFIMLLFIIACQQDNCSTKNQSLESFDQFLDEAEKNKDDKNDELRLQFEDRYKDLINTCYKKHRENLSLEERQDFWKKSVIYYFNRGGELSMELEIGSENDEAFNEYLQSELEQVIEDSGENFEKIIQNVIQENLLPGLNEIFKGIENLGKELQNTISK